MWLSQQLDMVAAFAAGKDVYRLTASPIYGVAPEALTKEQRQIGKVMVLFLGFAGGVNAFLPAAMNYGLTIERSMGVDIVKGFRGYNTNLVAFWNNTLLAAMYAVLHPGREFSVPPLNNITFKMIGNALCCRLPSGRVLRYWAPKLQQGFWPDGNPKPQPDLTVLVMKGKAIFRRTLWRGLLIENIVQAIAADLLANALDKLDQAALPVVLHVHDNAAAEVAERRAVELLPVFKSAMLDIPGWAHGLPMAAEVGMEARFS
jgi:DNA polymerase bacteriophage-type